MKSLYIFVDSERPDQYLNSIVYCILRMDVRVVVFIHIKGLANQGKSHNKTDGVSLRVSGYVLSLLEALAERGEYSYKHYNEVKEITEIKKVHFAELYGEETSQKMMQCYKRCRETSVTFTNLDINYVDLHGYVNDISKNNHECYIDITAIKKKYLGDFVASGFISGISGLFTFDLAPDFTPDFDHPWRMLFHELDYEATPKFEYINLLDTHIYRICTRALIILSPKLKFAAIASALLIILGCAIFWYFGQESTITQYILIISCFTSILSFVFVFLAPRNE